MFYFLRVEGFFRSRTAAGSTNGITRGFSQAEDTILGATFSGVEETRLPRSIAQTMVMGLLV